MGSAPETGLAQYVATGAYTGDVVPAAVTRPGLVNGGTFVPGPSAPVHRRSVGGTDSVKGAMLEPSGTIEMLPVDITALDYALRGATVTTALNKQQVDLAIGTVLHTHLQAKWNRLRLASSIGDPLAATLEYMAIDYDGTGVVADPAALSQSHWEWFEATLTLGGTGYGAQSFDIDLSNNLQYATDMDGAAADARRLPKYLVEGDETIAMTTGLNNLIPEATLKGMDDDLTEFEFVSVFYNGEVADNTLTITLAGNVIASWEIPVQGEADIVEYSYGFETQSNGNKLSLALSTV